MTGISRGPARVQTAAARGESAPAAEGDGEARRKPNRRAALLHAALEIFATSAYEDVSVDDICSRANVAHGLLSYHFGGKRQLFAEAVRLAWDELIAYERPLESEVTVVDKFHGYLSRHFDYFRRHPERFRLMMRSSHVDPQVSEVLASARRSAIEEIENFLGCPEDAQLALRTAIAGWAGFVDTVTLEYIENSTLEVDKITDMCAQVLVASVRSASDIPMDSAVELEAISRVAGLRSQTKPRNR